MIYEIRSYLQRNVCKWCVMNATAKFINGTGTTWYERFTCSVHQLHDLSNMSETKRNNGTAHKSDQYKNLKLSKFLGIEIISKHGENNQSLISLIPK